MHNVVCEAEDYKGMVICKRCNMMWFPNKHRSTEPNCHTYKQVKAYTPEERLKARYYVRYQKGKLVIQRKYATNGPSKINKSKCVYGAIKDEYTYPTITDIPMMNIFLMYVPSFNDNVKTETTGAL